MNVRIVIITLIIQSCVHVISFFSTRKATIKKEITIYFTEVKIKGGNYDTFHRSENYENNMINL